MRAEVVGKELWKLLRSHDLLVATILARNPHSREIAKNHPVFAFEQIFSGPRKLELQLHVVGEHVREVAPVVLVDEAVTKHPARFMAPQLGEDLL